MKVRGIDQAFLSDSNVHVLGVNPGDSVFIGVDVPCVNDGHCDDLNACTDDTCAGHVCQFTGNCDDFNDCTTDACNAGVCDFVDVTAGTPCEDGLFCTEPDTCDNKGACIGGANDPCLPGELCIEFMDICIPEQGGGGT